MEPAKRNPVSDESGAIASGLNVTLTIKAQLAESRANTKNRRNNDRMVMARIRKEINFMLNVKKEDKLIVTGLVT